jgi:transposase, IS5 family
MKFITPNHLKRVALDTTVSEKNIPVPTDNKRYHQMRLKRVSMVRELGITLRQTHGKECRFLMPKIGCYGHTKQYKRMRKASKKVKGYFGRVLQDLKRQIQAQGLAPTLKQWTLLKQARRLLAQKTGSKNKRYHLPTSEVDGIAKDKAHKRYEFGVKASVATTTKEAFIVGTRRYPGNPLVITFYDQ